MSYTLTPDDFLKIHLHLPPMFLNPDRTVRVRNYNFGTFTLGYDLNAFTVEEVLYQLDLTIKIRKGQNG